MAVRLIQGKQITGNLTGSFTGSFTGNGSGLTNLPVQVFNTGSFVTTSSFNAFTSTYNTGSFKGSFTGSFTGSLLGTASFAISGGNQNFQQVTNAGSSSTNTITLNPTVNTNGLNINTVYDENIAGVSTALKINQTSEGNGIDITTPNGNAIIISSGNGSAISINNSETGIYINNPEIGVSISDTGNLDTGISMNLTSTAKALVVSSTTSATGNFIELKKNGVDKLIVNYLGEVTAPSFTGSLFGTSSFATTASFAPLYLPLTGGTINGNVTLNGTASISYLNVLVESASVIYSSGSNQFGDATNDTQTLIGTVIVSGSQKITGSLFVNGFSNFTGTISSSVAPANNPSASLMVIGGTTIQSASILTSSAVLINPIMSASANSQTLVALDLQPTFTASVGTPVRVGMRVGDLGISDYSIRLGNTTNNYGTISSTGVISLQAQNSSILYASTVSTNLNGRSTTSTLNLGLGSSTFGNFAATTGNFILQNGGTFTDDTVNRLQVSGSARITNGLTVTGSLNVTGSITSSGNLLIQNGGTFTDNGYRLQVSGSARITNGLTVTGSLIAPSITGSLFGTASFATTASYASNGGVTSIVAGTNITVSSATGNVTINSTGGGGGGTDLGLVQAMTLGLQNIF